MATEKQIAANRLNAQKSTGPKTPEGRAAVRLNGVTHGLTAETLVLKGETESDFKALFESLEAEHQPTTPTEEILVADLAMATWRRRRLYNMEAGFYKVRMKNEASYAAPEKLDDTGIVGKVASNSGDTMALIGRQEARLERSYYKALHELQRLRAERERQANSALVSQSSPVGQGMARAWPCPGGPVVSTGHSRARCPNPRKPENRYHNRRSSALICRNCTSTTLESD